MHSIFSNFDNIQSKNFDKNSLKGVIFGRNNRFWQFFTENNPSLIKIEKKRIFSIEIGQKLNR